MDGSSRSAEELLAEYLRLVAEGAAPDFEAWVAGHPSREVELRALLESSARTPNQGAESEPRGVLSFLLGTRGAVAPFSIQAAASAGDVIGEFRLLRPIGSGGMGQVWEAEQTSLGRRVALKLIRSGCVQPQTLELFAREARAGGRLSHPGIVAVYGFGESAGVRWIAMELVPGGTTLRELIERMGQLPELPPGYYQEVARLVIELADALQAAHAAHVIHRDIKPQNVLLTAHGRPKLTDFGLARITDEETLTHSGEVAGTYFYMSPEQVVASRSGIDHRTDVFSLGVLLYELLGLVRPFQGDTAHQVAESILTHEPPDLRKLRSRVPPELAVIAGKALEKAREARFQSMAELAADLRRFLGNEPIQARQPTRWQRLAKWTRRNPTKSAAGGVAAAAFVAISLLLAQNVRANRSLTRTVGERDGALRSLRAANVDLAAQTEAAQMAADAERARAQEVLRLSALQEHAELVAEADDLERMWPPLADRVLVYLDWIERARRLRAGLPLHLATRAELRALALPRSEDERQEERAAHPRYRELLQLEERIDVSRRALAQRRDGVGTELPGVAEATAMDDAARLVARAAGLVDVEPEARGREPEAYALARLALERVEPEERALRARALSVLAQAAVALGRDEEGLDAAVEALGLSEGEASERAGEELARIEASVAAARTPEGLAAAEAELAALEAQRAALDAALDERRDWRFPEELSEARSWNVLLTKLIDDLESLADEESGLLGAEGVSVEHGWSVPLRLVKARKLAAGFAPGAEHDVRWQAALPAIHAAYPDLELPLQTGLVPLGPDPRSGLWEFWVVLSGAEPERAADGRLVIAEETGIVLVLIPAGAFLMGAQRDPSGPNASLQAEPMEAPVHEVHLSAFFLSKYELTQAQWLRFTGTIPSRFNPTSEPGVATWTNPVETVDWHKGRVVLRRLGLELPSEAQWERGARAGTSTPYSCPFEELASHANVADQAYGRRFSRVKTPEPWDDGYAIHAPVGSLSPNAFGLHDMHGNEWEWCLDGFDPTFYQTGPTRDPVAPCAEARNCMARGSCFLQLAPRARSAGRLPATPLSADSDVGVRPARGITR